MTTRLGWAVASLAAAVRHRGRRHHALATTSLAVAAPIVLVCGVLTMAVQRSTLHRGGGDNAAADGCAVQSLATTFPTAEQRGASIVTGQGTLTGVMARSGPDTLFQFRIRTDTLLAGAPLQSRIGWIQTTPAARRSPTALTAGIVPRPGAMWSENGSFFAVIWPRSETHNGVGPQMEIQPYESGSVIYAAAQCVDLSGVASTPTTGTFNQLPDECSSAIARDGGFRAVTLSVIERLAG